MGIDLVLDVLVIVLEVTICCLATFAALCWQLCSPTVFRTTSSTPKFDISVGVEHVEDVQAALITETQTARRKRPDANGPETQTARRKRPDATGQTQTARFASGVRLNLARKASVLITSTTVN
uniref:Secreted protein n=1 Tax=Globodera rostochiensis TaxID=31243 RepID=A0A914GW13_GLORO